MRTRALFAIAFGVLAAITASPASAQDDGDGDGGQPAPPPLLATPKTDPATMLGELEALAGTSIAAATNDPDNGYSPFPVQKSFGPGEDGVTPVTGEANTRLTSGVLDGQIIITTSDVRSVATVKAQVCPDTQGKVSTVITMSFDVDDRVIKATATGTSSNSAHLTSVKVTTADAKGAEAKLLAKIGKSILRHAEQGWRNGYCVKIDVSEGQSQAVASKKKVPISATAKQRFDGSEIKGDMTSKKTAGKKSVAPASASASPAKFTYTAPDKRPETGSVELKSVSKRGIGIAHLEYTTEGDLKIDAQVGPEHVTGVKCGGPVGTWELAGIIEGFGDEHHTFTLAEDTLSGPVASSGQAGGVPTSANGTATYTESPDGKSGTLSLYGGSVPVTIGTFCTNGAPPAPGG